jgi:hypothetical protein
MHKALHAWEIMRKACKIFGGKPEGKKPFGRPRKY